MKIEERVKEYIDDEGKRHEYTEVVQINEDGAEIIRATVDRVLSEEPKPEPQPSQLDRIEEMTASGKITEEEKNYIISEKNI